MKLAATSLVITLIAMTTGSTLAQAIHPVCLANHHGCDKAATIVACCCGDQGSTPGQTTPAQSRTEVVADLSAVPPLGNNVHVAPTLQPLVAVQTSAPRLCLLDLPTLFAAFLL
jgi:hypothetical protein